MWRCTRGTFERQADYMLAGGPGDKLPVQRCLRWIREQQANRVGVDGQSGERNLSHGAEPDDLNANTLFLG